jgi:hypothetical protein
MKLKIETFREFLKKQEMDNIINWKIEII